MPQSLSIKKRLKRPKKGEKSCKCTTPSLSPPGDTVMSLQNSEESNFCFSASMSNLDGQPNSSCFNCMLPYDRARSHDKHTPKITRDLKTVSLYLTHTYASPNDQNHIKNVKPVSSSTLAEQTPFCLPWPVVFQCCCWKSAALKSQPQRLQNKLCRSSCPAEQHLTS